MVNPTGYIRHFAACNKHNLADFLPFHIASAKPDVTYGWIGPKVTDILLTTHPTIFLRDKSGITLVPSLTTFATRSSALAEAVGTLSQRLHKTLRNEKYAVLGAWGDEPLAEIDRIAVPWFGIPAFGVHVNGYVKKSDGLYLWVGERATNRSVDPGMLDNMIGGGQPIGLGIRDNLRKEAQEEAGLSGALIDNAVHARTMNYMMERQGGIRNDTLFIFDVEMPEGIKPVNTDGEVAAFHLIPAHKVAQIVHDTNRFKFNCNLVIIDFLIRHGIITAEDSEFAGLMPYLSQKHSPDNF